MVRRLAARAVRAAENRLLDLIVGRWAVQAGPLRPPAGHHSWEPRRR